MRRPDRRTAARFTWALPPRAAGRAVLLPNGKVFVSGGVPTAGSDAGAVLTAELYDPATRSWSVLEPAKRARNYHSVALLMPDGSVWVAGSNIDCKPSDKNHNTHEPLIEVYKPSYCFAQRPAITRADAHIAYDSDAYTFDSPQASRLSRVAIMRAGSTTHAFDADQRYVELSFEAAGGSRVRVSRAPSPAVAPPGTYLLFAIDGAGVPSVGRFVQVG